MGKTITLLNTKEKPPICVTNSVIFMPYKKAPTPSSPRKKGGNYRLIALVNVISMIISRLFCNRLKLLPQKIIPILQTGFTHERTISKKISS